MELQPEDIIKIIKAFGKEKALNKGFWGGPIEIEYYYLDDKALQRCADSIMTQLESIKINKDNEIKSIIDWLTDDSGTHCVDESDIKRAIEELKKLNQ